MNNRREKRTYDSTQQYSVCGRIGRSQWSHLAALPGTGGKGLASAKSTEQCLRLGTANVNHAALCSTRPERKMTTRSVNMEASDDLMRTVSVQWQERKTDWSRGKSECRGVLASNHFYATSLKNGTEEQRKWKEKQIPHSMKLESICNPEPH